MYCAKRRRRLLAPLLLTCLFAVALLGTWLSAVSFLRREADDDGIVERVKRGAPVPLRQREILAFGFGCSRNHTAKPAVSEDYLEEDEEEIGQFPRDAFSLQQRQHGAVALHMFGLIYMFIALAIVCDEFFVPSLTVITEKLDISEDVAGATFMAAGGSAPEFFTSVIGVFIAQNNVGIGTIVGSATFNILCVLAFCTIFSTTVLHLTWWPIFRDVTFYIVSLLMLVIFFLDEKIVWWEALSLFTIYILYATFMKFNADIELMVKTTLGLVDDETLVAAEEDVKEPMMEKSASQLTYARPDRPNPMGMRNSRHVVDLSGLHRSESLAIGRRRGSSLGGRRQSIPLIHAGSMFRNGIMQQIMSHTMEPLCEDGKENGDAQTYRRKSSACSVKASPQNGGVVIERQPPRENGISKNRAESMRSHGERRSTKADIDHYKAIIEDEPEQPLDMTWPEEFRKQLIYIFVAPILFPLWVTLPDVRREESKKWFPWTFVGSIFWIAAFSYLMVWWANTIGETFVIPTEIIGLTILAAGTSIPDLITSVIVARKGLGDMAVSSSVGSNIFDVCVGLPIPWLLYFIMEPIRSGNAAAAVAVSSNGLVCSVGMLFIMLLLLILAIALCGWQMNKAFGIVMIVSYIGFCVVSVSLETGHFQCPLRIC